MMTLGEAARRAREHAETCIDPSCHRVATALEAALAAERGRRRRGEPIPADAPPIPPWSAVSRPGTSEGPLPFTPPAAR